MNDSLFSTKDMVKYLIVAGLVYTILKMIPSVQLADKDLILLLAIITVGFVCLDCLFLKKTEGFANEDPFTLDLDTDVNELIKQRQSRKNARQESTSTISEKLSSEEVEREQILSRLDEKRQKSSDPIKITKEEIKKLDEQIANAFTGADAEKAKKTKAELETKLEVLKTKELTTQEADKVSKIQAERARVEQARASGEYRTAAEQARASGEYSSYRATAEEKRAAAEQARASGEYSSYRATAEEKRAAAEQARASGEYSSYRATAEEKRAIIEEKYIAEDEHVDAIKSSIVAEERLDKLNARKAEITKSGTASEVRAITEEIKVATKAKEVADEHVNIISERKEIIEKKLANIPVSEAEERRLAIAERDVTEEKVLIADELKAMAEKRGSSSSELKQVLQEKSNAIRANNEAEDRLVRARTEVEARRRIVIDESVKLPENELGDGSRALPKTSCGLEVEKIKRQMEEQLTELKEQLQARASIPPSSAKIANRYFESLMNDLADKGILEDAEIDNIQAKLRTKLLSMDEVIASLESLKKEGKSKVRVHDGKVKNDREYSELPSDFYTSLGQQVPNDWSSEYTILNTNKWQVPMPRPPVCINTAPCKVCPTDSSNNSVNLKQWDDSRYVTGGKINKKWAEDQNSA